MNKKVLAIIGMAAVIAISGGVIAATSDRKAPTEPTGTASEPSAAYTDNADDSSGDQPEEVDTEATLPDVPDETYDESSETEHTLPTRQEETIEPSVPYEEQIISATYTVDYALDHTNGMDVSPRVVFGASHSYCYVKFDADRRFEICLDPASGATRYGTYHIYGNTVSVEYDDGVGSEYDIVTDSEGNIIYLIVNYGDYDVYFG